MSAIYNLEPQPNGSAVLQTTLGEISVELFGKQSPLAVRNFLQHALDGYYDDTIFHRLVPGFILQGGDPTGTGNGGESIFDGGAFSGELEAWPMDERRGRNAGEQGVGFKDEFHSRLKLNRRGLLAMANEGKPDTNGSQFFFTLDKADELNGKNTMFGRVAGDTIYNLMKIGESEIAEGTEQPLYPIKIQKIEILVNPFEDMKKRSRFAAPLSSSNKDKGKDKKKKRKGGKQLLSFGDEEGEGDIDLPVLKKAKFDTRLIADDGEDEQPAVKSTKSKSKPKKEKEQPSKPAAESSEDQDGQDHERIPEPVKERPAKPPPPPKEPSPSPEPEERVPEKTALQKANEEMAALKASMRRTIHTEKIVEEKPKTALESMIPESSVKGARKRRKGGAGSMVDDPKTLKMLQAFQSKLNTAPPEKMSDVTPTPAEAGEADGDAKKEAAPTEGEDEGALCDLHFIANCQSCTAWDKQAKDDSDDEGWMAHTLSFAADKLGKDLSNRRKAEEELIVIDPREKARALKEGKRSERDKDRGSGKAWDQRRDQARNAKLAQASSLAGRGAK